MSIRRTIRREAQRRTAKGKTPAESAPVNKSGNSRPIFVHAVFRYGCEKCGMTWNMFCENGIEGMDKNGIHKPSPFVIQCPYCGDSARDISGLYRFSALIPLPEGQSYFADKPDCDCGTPVYIGFPKR